MPSFARRDLAWARRLRSRIPTSRESCWQANAFTRHSKRLENRGGVNPRKRLTSSPIRGSRRARRWKAARSTSRPRRRRRLVRTPVDSLVPRGLPDRPTERRPAGMGPSWLTDTSVAPPPIAITRRYEVPSHRSTAFSGRRRSAQAVRSSRKGLGVSNSNETEYGGGVRTSPPAVSSAVPLPRPGGGEAAPGLIAVRARRCRGRS